MFHHFAWDYTGAFRLVPGKIFLTTILSFSFLAGDAVDGYLVTRMMMVGGTSGDVFQAMRSDDIRTALSVNQVYKSILNSFELTLNNVPTHFCVAFYR